MYRTMHFLLTLLTLSLISSVHAVTWYLAQNISGSKFFDYWNYQNGIDANTTGNVLFQTREQAMQEQLTFINSAGNAIIKVDNTTDGTRDPTFGRPSVKLLSRNSINQGSLVILDAVHMPFGCSVWPAFWTQGPNWPYDGEIDIIENVNLATNNQYSLHTVQGCMHPPASDSSSIETGILAQADCFNRTNGNEGCLIRDSSANSFGAGFAKIGGGVFALLWDDSGIHIWFFERSSIPSDVPTGNPNPAGWPLPTASYPTSFCDTSKFFRSQTIIFDISICGNFAGLPNVFNPSCTGRCTDLVQTPSHYNDAYFEIRYLHVFSSNPTTSGTASSSPPSSTNSRSSGPNITATNSLVMLAVLSLTTFAMLITIFT